MLAVVSVLLSFVEDRGLEEAVDEEESPEAAVCSSFDGDVSSDTSFFALPLVQELLEDDVLLVALVLLLEEDVLLSVPVEDEAANVDTVIVEQESSLIFFLFMIFIFS